MTEDRHFKWHPNHYVSVYVSVYHYCKSNFIKCFNTSWKGNILHSVTDSAHSRGVCIMFKKILNVEILNTKSCDAGRLLLVNIKINSEIISLVNVYAPNSEIERTSFYSEVEKWIIDHSLNVNNLVIAGGFNCCHLASDDQPPTHLRIKAVDS